MFLYEDVTVKDLGENGGDPNAVVANQKWHYLHRCPQLRERLVFPWPGRFTGKVEKVPEHMSEFLGWAHEHYCIKFDSVVSRTQTS